MAKSKLQIGTSGTSNFSRAGLGLPVSNTGGRQTAGNKYIPFSNDSFNYRRDNLYPQQLARLVYDSPTHGAAINRKTFMIKGEGFDTSDLSKNMLRLFNSINGEGETMNDVLQKVSFDYATFGGIALKVKWANNGTIIALEHVPFTDVRCGMPDENNKVYYYVVNNNWDKTLSNDREQCYSILNFNPSVFNEIPEVDGIYTPTDLQVDNSEQLIYWKPYALAASNGLIYYPMPDYACGLDSIITEVEIVAANKSRITNGMGAKTIIAFPSQLGTEDERQEIHQNLVDNYAGAYNDGALIPIFVPKSQDMPTIEHLPAPSADTYIELENSTRQAIISAHGIPSILLEVNVGGGFNNRAEEMREAYSIFQQTRIKAYQLDILRVFNRVASYMGFDADLSIIPFQIQVDANSTVSANSTQTNLS